MILWSIRQVLNVRSVFLAQDSPRRLALGTAFGMILGLLPKGNLLAVGISTVILATRVNLGTAMLAAAVFSFAGVFLDPFTHELGWSLLNAEALQPTWTFLYGLPLAPWTSFNNTVVLGSLMAGLAMAYPTYWASYTAFDRWQGALARRVRTVVNEPTRAADAEQQEVAVPAFEAFATTGLGAASAGVVHFPASALVTTATSDRWWQPECVCVLARAEDLRVTWSEGCWGAALGLPRHALAGELALQSPRSI